MIFHNRYNRFYRLVIAALILTLILIGNMYWVTHQYRMIFKGSYDTEDWSNDDENVAFGIKNSITWLNYILKKLIIKVALNFDISQYYFIIILLFFLSNRGRLTPDANCANDLHVKSMQRRERQFCGANGANWAFFHAIRATSPSALYWNCALTLICPV